MKNKNLVVIVSIIVGVAAAVAATLLILKYFNKKKAKLAASDYVFENDFDQEDEEYLDIAE